MMHPIRWISRCVLCAALCAEAACAQPREIAVNITVGTASGAMVEDAPIAVRGYGDLALAMTGANGQVTIQLEEQDPSADRLAVSISPWSYREDRATAEEIQYSEQRYESLSAQYAIPFMAWAALQPGVDEYNLLIILENQIEVTGRVVSADSEAPMIVHVGVLGWDAEAVSDATGQFVLAGVPMGAALALVVLPDSPFVYYWPLSASQTSEDLAMGDMLIPEHVLDGRIQVTVTNREWLSDRNGVLINQHVALIRSDGQYALNYYVNELDEAFDATTGLYPKDPLSIPAGAYYAAPGFWGHDTHEALRRALLEGRQAQLDAAGVPKVVVPADETPIELSMDATATRDAILAVGGDLLD